MAPAKRQLPRTRVQSRRDQIRRAVRLFFFFSVCDVKPMTAQAKILNSVAFFAIEQIEHALFTNKHASITFVVVVVVVVVAASLFL